MTLLTDTQRSLLDRTTVFPDTAAWLADRKRGLGASEIAACLGMSKYADATPFRTWANKQPDHDPEQGERPERFKWGHKLEPVILAEFADRHPEVRVGPVTELGEGEVAIVQHPEFPTLFGTPDALCWDGDEIAYGVDAKNLGAHQRSEFGVAGSGDVPVDYALQAVGYMAIFDVDCWHFAVLFGSSEYHEFVVYRDAALEAEILGRALDWWQVHVVEGLPPELDGADSTTTYLRHAFPRANGPMLETSEAAEFWRSEKLHADEAVRVATAEKKRAENELRKLCGDAEGIEGVCTYRNNKDGEAVDHEGVARYLRDVLESYCDTAAAGAHWQNALASHTKTKPGARVLRVKK